VLARGFLISLICLVASSPALATKGIIELGIAGQAAKLSTFQVFVDGQMFTEGSHLVGESSTSIAEKVRANIDASPAYVATIPDPNHPTAIEVLKVSSGDLTSLEVFIDDPNIGGAFVESSDSPGLSATVRGVDGIAGDGNFELDITVVCTGMPPELFTQVVSTSGKTRDGVNAAMVAALKGNGFSVVGPANGPWKLTHTDGRIRKTQMRRTDTGIHVTGVQQDTSSTATSSIPTLSEWGSIALMVLLGGVAVTLLRRRAARTI